MRTMNAARKGFTLLELAIVLAIVGLIVGGIFSGQSLIRSAELNNVISEFRKYQTAMTQFRDKYSALPGDMSNATNYWTALSGSAGNGDGMIQNTGTATSNEVSLFWLELSQSALIEGTYSSFTNATATAGTNVPKSKLRAGGWNVAYLGTVGFDSNASANTGAISPSTTTFYEGTYEHVLIISGGTTPLSNAATNSGVFDAVEAQSIDAKLDDGFPSTGDIVSMEFQGITAVTATAGCGNKDASTSATTGTTAYNTLNTSRTACSLVFKTGL